MAKVQLKAGAELDLLSGPEAEELLTELGDRLDTMTPSSPMRAEASVVASAAGVLGGGYNGNGVELWKAPPGFSATIHRISVSADGFTAGAPLLVGSMGLYRSQPNPMSQEIFLPQSGVVAPVVIVDGEGAMLLLGGEALVAAGTGFAANQQFYFAFQYRLWVPRQPRRPGR